MAFGIMNVPGSGGSGTQTSTGAPTSSTSAVAGEQYFDTRGQKLYICTGVDGSGQTSWKVVWSADGSHITIGSEGKTLDQVVEEIKNTPKFSINSTAPADTTVLWIDPDTTNGGLKYYNGSAWVHVPVAYT
jgi:hypothetical protein